MKRCEKCGVQFSGDLDRCPLCQAELSGDASPAVFPRNEVRKSGAIALAVLAFATGACLLVMLFLGHLLQLPGDTVVTVCVGLVVNYLFVRNILTHTPDFLRVVARYFLVLLAVFRGTFVSGYAKYLLFDVGLGLIPLALQALGLTTWDVPSLVSALTASVFLLGLVVFARKQLTAEIRKLFSA